MPRCRQVASGKKAGGKEGDGKWEKTEKCINRELAQEEILRAKWV